MNDNLVIFDYPTYELEVKYVSLMDPEPTGFNLSQVLMASSAEVVEDTDLVSLLQQRVRYMAPDEARASRYQHFRRTVSQGSYQFEFRNSWGRQGDEDQP